MKTSNMIDLTNNKWTDTEFCKEIEQQLLDDDKLCPGDCKAMLHVICSNGFIKSLETCAKHPMFEAVIKNSKSLVTLAAMNGHAIIVCELINMGAKYKIHDSRGTTTGDEQSETTDNKQEPIKLSETTDDQQEPSETTIKQLETTDNEQEPSETTIKQLETTDNEQEPSETTIKQSDTADEQQEQSEITDELHKSCDKQHDLHKTTYEQHETAIINKIGDTCDPQVLRHIITCMCKITRDQRLTMDELFKHATLQGTLIHDQNVRLNEYKKCESENNATVTDLNKQLIAHKMTIAKLITANRERRDKYEGVIEEQRKQQTEHEKIISELRNKLVECETKMIESDKLIALHEQHNEHIRIIKDKISVLIEVRKGYGDKFDNSLLEGLCAKLVNA